MAQKTKIKKDFIGLYVITGGWISRPFYGTIFKEGDEVKTHHFGGSTKSGVTFNKPELKFKKTKDYETWSTTGISNYEYVDKIFEPNKFEGLYSKQYSTFEEYITLTTEWYKNNGSASAIKIFALADNENFKKRFLQ